MIIAVIFPYPREKGIVNHPEQIPAGGCFSYVYALRAQGHRVHVINLYNENNQIDEAQARIEYERIAPALDLALVFDTGQVRVNWKEISDDFETIVLYHAGDDPMRFDANCDTLATGAFDGVLCAQKPSVAKYEAKFNLPAIWVPYHHDPYLHYPEPVTKTHDVAHSGKIYGLREPMLKAMQAAGMVLNVEEAWGQHFRMNYLRSRVGWHQAWCGELGYRHFEIPAMGIPLVCDELDEEYGLFDIFEEGQIFTYTGNSDEDKVEDCIRTIRNVLDDSRSWIAAGSAYNTVRRNHTPIKRCEKILDFARQF